MRKGRRWCPQAPYRRENRIKLEQILSVEVYIFKNDTLSEINLKGILLKTSVTKSLESLNPTPVFFFFITIYTFYFFSPHLQPDTLSIS